MKSFTEKQRQVLNKVGAQTTIDGVIYKNVNKIVIGSDGSRRIFQNQPVTNSVTIGKVSPGSIAERAVKMALAKAKHSTNHFGI